MIAFAIDVPRMPQWPLSVLAESFGEEGRMVHEAAARAASHWEDRAEWLLASASTSDNEFYSSVPWDDAGVVHVKFELAGDLEPVPYDWDN